MTIPKPLFHSPHLSISNPMSSCPQSPHWVSQKLTEPEMSFRNNSEYNQWSPGRSLAWKMQICSKCADMESREVHWHRETEGVIIIYRQYDQARPLTFPLFTSNMRNSRPFFRIYLPYCGGQLKQYPHCSEKCLAVGCARDHDLFIHSSFPLQWRITIAVELTNHSTRSRYKINTSDRIPLQNTTICRQQQKSSIVLRFLNIRKRAYAAGTATMQVGAFWGNCFWSHSNAHPLLSGLST